MATEFNAGAVDYKKKKLLIRTIFNNMISHQGGEVKAGILLKGDTGVGKTSFVRDLVTLLGIPLVMIETPHITEEHIINIPFIVSSPVESNDKKMVMDIDQRKYNVELADSNLFTQINKQRIVPDSEYLANIYNEHKTSDDLRKVFESFGGSKDKIPDKIKTLRSWYRCVLFLDEYFRQTSPTIRNMLRTILNGRLGELHELPKDLYVIYASNIVDEGVGEIASQEQFHGIYFGTEGENNGQTIDYEITTDEWFGHIVSKFKKDHHVQLNKKVIDKFYQLFTENAEDIHLSVNDIKSDVRTSPRRWEQIILYVNSSLPVKNDKDAKSLLTNIRTSFVTYEHGDKEAQYNESSILKLVLQTVRELIEETSGVTISDNSSQFNAPTKWRDTLEHQIQQAMKLGHHRKYIPVIAGTPGIAKTTHMNNLAVDLMMVPVVFDVSHISAESIIGLPIPHETKDKGIETEFSVPILYNAMMKQIKEGEKHLFDSIKKNLSGDEAEKKIKEYKSKEYKYILFFDELNRAPSTKVFNAMRRVLLERNFGEDAHGKELKIPEGSVIVAAINPTGENTIAFTRHIKDVLDIIPAGASWKDFSKVLDNMNYKKLNNNDAPHKDVIKLGRSVLDAFVNRFKARHSPSSENDKEFYIDLDPEGSSHIYISPRSYQDILAASVREFDDEYKELLEKISSQTDESESKNILQEANIDIREALYKSYRYVLSVEIDDKQNKRSSPHLWKNLHEWFLHSTEFDVLDALKISVKTSPLTEILDRIYDKPDTQLFDDMDFISYINNTDEQTYAADLEEYLTSKYDSVAVITDRTLPMKTLVDRDVKIEKETVTRFEYLIREILHTIKIHNLSGHMLEVTRHAFMKFALFASDEEKNTLRGIKMKKFNDMESLITHIKDIVPKKYHNQIVIGTTPLDKAKKDDGTWVLDNIILLDESTSNPSAKRITELKSFFDEPESIELAKHKDGEKYESFETLTDAIRNATFYLNIGRLKLKIVKIIKAIFK